MTTGTQKQPRPAIDHVGQVRILERCSKGYYRLKWPAEKGDTSAGRTLQAAREKATRINASLSSTANPYALTPLPELVRAFIEEGTSPYPSKQTGKLEKWKPAQRENVRKALARCLRNHEHCRPVDLLPDRELVDAMRAQGGTYAVVRSNTSALRAFLTWLGRKRYITWQQAEMLPDKALTPEPTLPRRSVLIRDAGPRTSMRQNGAAHLYVRDEDAPSRQQVEALSRAMSDLVPAWGELAPEFAAGTGARWGEQFQLTADDACLNGCPTDTSAHIHIEWQIDPAGKANADRRVPPKGNKSRRLPLDERSFTGFPLRDAVALRISEARRERAAGTNPEALLFPSARGGLLWYTSFASDLLMPAMEAAGWPVDIYEDTWQHWDGEKFVTRVSHRREARLPWHSHRHRFARTCVDIKRLDKGALMAIGGWENIRTVEDRYYRSGEDAMRAGTAAFNG